MLEFKYFETHHRQLGVHISRTQSIVIDVLSTSQLLISIHRQLGVHNLTLHHFIKLL